MIRLAFVLFFLIGGGIYFGILSPQNDDVGVAKEKSVEEVLIEAIVAKKIMTKEQLDAQVIGRFGNLEQQVEGYYSKLASQRREQLGKTINAKQGELKGQKIRLNDCSSSCQYLENSVAEIEQEILDAKRGAEKDLELLNSNRDEKLSDIHSDYMKKLNELVLKVKDEG